MSKLAEFMSLYALYRSGGHTVIYSARIAFGCAFKGLPF